ncbi:MAG: hypothetical protein JXQ23_13905 [Clostridia bacterium]|nr:hypothetical protein [Clostridia bacterium]
MKQKGIKTVFLILIILSAGISFLLSPLFTIKSIYIKEIDDFKYKDIYDNLGITVGDNVFLSIIKNGNVLSLEFTKAAERLHDRFKTLKNIRIYSVFPDQVRVDYDISSETFELMDDEKIIVTDEDGYVLDVDNSHKKGRIKVSGLPVNDYGIYQYIETDPVKLDNLKMIYHELQQYDSVHFTAFREYIDWIDFSNDLYIAIMYDDRVLVKINYNDNLSYKMASMCVILSEQIGPEEKGVLDMTIEGSSIFSPK